MAQWDALSEQVKYYGLIPEPPDYRAWQKCLMDIPFPDVQRSSDSTLRSVYTDGSCLFPRWERLRVASFSAILAKPDGSFEVLGQGLLPTGCHTAYRAEIFGAAVAVRTFKKVVVTLDCKGVVDTCRYLQRLLIDHSRVVLPSDNTDLWAYLVEGLRGCDVASCAFRWVKGHQKWTNGNSLQRIDAWFNHWADRVASVPGHWLCRENPTFRRLILAHRRRRSLAAQVFRYHSCVAMAFASTSTSLPQGPTPVVDSLIGLGEPFSPNTVDVALCHVYHEGFARKLLRWLDKLQWFPQTQCGTRTDTSWLELFWGFLFDTSLLPPVRHGGEWLTVDDGESIYFVLPPVRNLFAVWKRLLDSLCKGGLSVPWDARVARVASVGSLGCRFACSGFCGFVPISRSALCDLALQFRGASCLSDLRIPFVN